MPHCIARIFESLMRLLVPPGRHRAGGAHSDVPRAAATAGRLTRVPVLRGEDTVMVRPYLVVHERRQQARKPSARPRAFWTAVAGVPLDPRLECGMGVAAP
ncbi:hypothetical protein [Streptomyces platensis]|uniref:hypothetical protein n=1 Tax=Streptomyces platensis TaxID=58346 RepID=UPI002E260C18